MSSDSGTDSQIQKCDSFYDYLVFLNCLSFHIVMNSIALKEAFVCYFSICVSSLVLAFFLYFDDVLIFKHTCSDFSYY